MNLKNKLQKFFFLLLVIIPLNVFAYSDYVVVGGNNIGIEVQSNGIIVVGFYDVNGKQIGRDSGFNLGDIITKIDNNEVTSIEDMAKKINDSKDKNKVNFTVLRKDSLEDIELKLFREQNGVYKTGLYVKDKITGIGTLTYIDPNSKIYGALGHEIVNWRSITK